MKHTTRITQKALVGLLLSAAMIMLTGCKTMEMQESKSAVITSTSEDSKMELVRVISSAMNGRSVKLANDVLTKSNEVVIQQNDPSILGHDPIGGRIMERPQHFKLFLRGTGCYLMHMETEQEYPLEKVVCVEQASQLQ